MRLNFQIFERLDSAVRYNIKMVSLFICITLYIYIILFTFKIFLYYLINFENMYFLQKILSALVSIRTGTAKNAFVWQPFVWKILKRYQTPCSTRSVNILYKNIRFLSIELKTNF